MALLFMLGLSKTSSVRYINVFIKSIIVNNYKLFIDIQHLILMAYQTVLLGRWLCQSGLG